MRHQLPVYSPLTAGAVLRSLITPEGSNERLRNRLSERFRVDPESVVLTGTGTQALGLAIGLAKRARGHGRAALPAYTCWDVGSAAQSAGVTASYFDIDPDHLTPDLASFEAALRTGVDAAVVSPLFGYPVDWDEIAKLCEAHGCLLIEDAAQGHGTSWHDLPAGSFGDLSMVSFGRGKGWTGGGGGALLARSSEIDVRRDPGPLPRARPGSAVAWSGMALAQALLGRPALYGLPATLPGVGLGETVYHAPQRAKAMLSATAALVLRTESWADGEAEVRRRSAVTLIERLATLSHVRIIRPSLSGGGFLRVAARIPGASHAWERSVRRLGVERGYPLPLPAVPELKDTLPAATHQVPGLSGAGALARTLFTIPTHSRVREGDLERIVTALSGH